MGRIIFVCLDNWPEAPEQKATKRNAKRPQKKKKEKRKKKRINTLAFHSQTITWKPLSLSLR